MWAKNFVLLLALCSFALAQNACDIDDYMKVDCGYSGINQQGCNQKGCCWVPAYQGSSIPWCFYGTNHSGSVPLPPPAYDSSPFTQQDMNTMYGYYRANLDIQNLGGVVASPDNSTPGGSYYYHWERDGALSMNALQLVTQFSTYNPLMQSYISWVLNVQNEPDPNGIDVRTEPKYFLPYGAVYTGGWCRPQTDGPGLRATTLITYANNLLAQSQNNMDYIRQYLWTGSSSYNGGAIKFDLDWIVSGWQQNGCDLWEEVQSTDFFWNRFTMKNALFLGSTFATLMGDSSSSATYLSTAQAINATIMGHWNGNFIFESTNRKEDSAVILGLNNGYSNDNFLAPTDPMVTSTINTLNFLFYFAFPINQADSTNGIPGILYGRYQGDTYAGGNPWILTSASLAQLFYRGATYVIESNKVPDSRSFQDWQHIFHNLTQQYYDIDAIHAFTPLQFSQAIASAGDAVLQRIYYHVQSSQLHLPEQLDKNTGAEASATDLTWSYATVLKAMWYRNNFSATAIRIHPGVEGHPSFPVINWNI